ncbi:ankyrin repeat-containing domain protein [Hypoxylon crocopeplum]|nr:ankyrin repeat-containing domain protein [Hypoxylon crocopeplum]
MKQIGIVEKLLAAGENPNIPHRLEMERPYHDSAATKDLPISPGHRSDVADEDYAETIHQAKASPDDPYLLLERLYASPYRLYQGGNEPGFAGESRSGNQYSPEVSDSYSPAPCYWFPLHSAAKAGCGDIIQLLVEHGSYLDLPSSGFCLCPHDPDLDYPGDESVFPWDISYTWTPLHVALCYRNEAAANLFISLGASLGVGLGGPLSAVTHSAAAHGCLRTLQYLHDNKYPIDMNGKDRNGLTPLHYARDRNSSPSTNLWLVTHGADINTALGHDGYTVLHAACINEDFQLAIDYIDMGANIHAVWKHLRDGDMGPIHLACRRGFELEIFPDYNREAASELKLKSLLSEGSPDRGRIELVKKLLELGADVEVPGGVGNTAINFASASHLIPIMELLVSAGSDICRESSWGGFPLLEAVPQLLPTCKPGNGDLPRDTVAWLLDRGADPNQVSNVIGCGALTAVCGEARDDDSSDWQTELTELLLKRGADPNIRDGRGDSPLQVAIRYRLYDTARCLVQNGAILPEGSTGLLTMLKEIAGHRYVPNYQDRQLRLLLEIDKHKELINNPMALWYTTRSWSLPMAEIILDAGASDPNWVDEHGATCFHDLAYDPHAEHAVAIAERLFSLGVTVELGMSLRIAIKRRKWALVRVLLRHGVQFKPDMATNWDIDHECSNNCVPRSSSRCMLCAPTANYSYVGEHGRRRQRHGYRWLHSYYHLPP